MFYKNKTNINKRMGERVLNKSKNLSFNGTFLAFRKLKQIIKLFVKSKNTCIVWLETQITYQQKAILCLI